MLCCSLCRSQHPRGVSDVSWLHRIDSVAAAWGLSDHWAGPAVPPRLGQLNPSLSRVGLYNQTAGHPGRPSVPGHHHPGAVRHPDSTHRESEFVGRRRWSAYCDHDYIVAGEVVCKVRDSTVSCRCWWVEATPHVNTAAACPPRSSPVTHTPH